jgi:hypothetical protein
LLRFFVPLRQLFNQWGDDHGVATETYVLLITGFVSAWHGKYGAEIPMKKQWYWAF